MSDGADEESGVRPTVDASVSVAALMRTLWSADQRPEWHARAACREKPAFWWDGGPHYGEWARAVCHRCPVMQACLADVIAWETETTTRSRNPMGVAGGTTATERYQLYRAAPSGVGAVGTVRRRSPRRRSSRQRFRGKRS